MSERLKEGDSVQASRPGLRSSPEAATIMDVLPKGYRVRFVRDGKVMKLAESKVKPKGGPARKPLRSKKGGRVKLGLQQVKLEIEWDATDPKKPVVKATTIEKNGQPVPKNPEPEKCLAWLDFVRGKSCCNCNKTAPSDPHHEGKRGVGQKVRDTLTAPLCRFCHRTYTDQNCLPLPRSVPDLESKPLRGLELRSREESLQILRETMLRMYQNVLARMPQELRCDVLSAALARMDQDKLIAVLKGDL